MDDTLFYRNAFPTISAPVSQLQDVESTSHDSNKLSGSPEKVHTPVNTTSHTGGSYTMPEAYSYPRTYLEILAPIHRFKEDKTTFIQYFCRPLILVLFPNVVLVSYYTYEDIRCCSTDHHSPACSMPSPPHPE